MPALRACEKRQLSKPKLEANPDDVIHDAVVNGNTPENLSAFLTQFCGAERRCDLHVTGYHRGFEEIWGRPTEAATLAYERDETQAYKDLLERHKAEKPDIEQRVAEEMKGSTRIVPAVVCRRRF